MKNDMPLTESSYAEQEAKMTAWRNGTRNERVTAITSKDKLETDFRICTNKKYYGEAKQIYNQAVSVYKSFGASRKCDFIWSNNLCYEMFMLRAYPRYITAVTSDLHWQDVIGRSVGSIANQI